MKKCMTAAVLAAAVSATQAFSLLGPWGDWQVLALGYQFNTLENPERDPGGPMNIREGYRWNIPTITYAVDRSFLEHFGEKGEAEIDRVFETLNDTLAHMYDEDYLDTLPSSTTRYNYRAQALGLYDVYSTALESMVELLGLAAPERYCWTLREIDQPDENITNYYTIGRNFDPDTLELSPYVNGTLYSYRIIVGGEYTEAMEIVPDPTASENVSVAGGTGNLHQDIRGSGYYYTGLTRDDVGGLRWLYSADNFAYEGVVSGNKGEVSVMVPQYDQMLIVTNYDLAQFVIDTENTTNTPSQVLALYPGLNLTGTNQYWERYLETNYVYKYQDSPWLPVGTQPALVQEVEEHLRFLYTYTYDNVYTNFGGTVTEDTFTLVTVSSGPQIGNPWLPAGYTGGTNSVTNYTRIDTNRVTGGIMIMSDAVGGTNTTDTNVTTTVANLAGYKFLDTNFVKTVYVTNLLWSASTAGGNGTGTTNEGGTTGDTTDTGVVDDGTGTNTVASTVDQYIIRKYDLYEYVVHPIVWVSAGETTTGEGDGETTDTNTVAGLLYRPGLGNQLRFQKVYLDNIIGTTFTPTNMYFSNISYMEFGKDINYKPGEEPHGYMDTTIMKRTVSAPDILFSATDMDPTAMAVGLTYSEWQNYSDQNWGEIVSTNAAGALGPGVVVPSNYGLVFNTSRNGIWVNTFSGPLSLFQPENEIRFWASFDGSTNEPYLYPVSTTNTIKWLEHQLTNSIPANQ